MIVAVDVPPPLFNGVVNDTVPGLELWLGPPQPPQPFAVSLNEIELRVIGPQKPW